MKRKALYLQSVFYLAAGLNHFKNPHWYLGLIPPYIPAPELVNVFAGTVESILGILLLLPKTRLWASYGLVAMLLAFIPSHIYFIQIGACIEGGLCTPEWVGWVRLLLIHPLLLSWAWWCRK